MNIAATLYTSIGFAYALLTFYKIRRFTARWHLLTNMLLWPGILYKDFQRGERPDLMLRLWRIQRRHRFDPPQEPTIEPMRHW